MRVTTPVARAPLIGTPFHRAASEGSTQRGTAADASAWSTQRGTTADGAGGAGGAGGAQLDSHFWRSAAHCSLHSTRALSSLNFSPHPSRHSEALRSQLSLHDPPRGASTVDPACAVPAPTRSNVTAAATNSIAASAVNGLSEGRIRSIVVRDVARAPSILAEGGRKYDLARRPSI